MCYSTDSLSVDRQEAQAVRDDAWSPLQQVEITSLSYPEDSKSAIPVTREIDGRIYVECNLTAIVDITKLAEIVKPGGCQGIKGSENAQRQLNQLLLAFFRSPPKPEEPQNDASCELSRQPSDESIVSPVSTAPNRHEAAAIPTESTHCQGQSQPQSQAPRVYCPIPVKASQKNLAISVTDHMNVQFESPRSSEFRILPKTICAASAAPGRGAPRKADKPTSSRAVRVVREVPDSVINEAITLHRQNVPWLKVFYKLLSEQYRLKLGKVMNDLDIKASDLPRMDMKELRKLWRITHRRWHSSRQCQERKERAREQPFDTLGVQGQRGAGEILSRC